MASRDADRGNYLSRNYLVGESFDKARVEIPASLAGEPAISLIG